MRHHHPPKLRRLVHHRAHELAAGAAAGDGNAAGPHPAALDQVPGSVHKVVEGVGAASQLAVVVPRPPELTAAAHMGDGEDEPAVQERKPRRGEPGRHRCAIRAVAVEIERSAAVQGRVLAAHDGDGDGGAVTPGRLDAHGVVARRVVATGHFPHLAHRERFRRDVVIDHRVWRHHRGVAKAHSVRRVLWIGTERNGAQRFREGHPPAPTLAVDDADLIDAVETLLHNDPIFEALKAAQVVCWAAGHQGGPTALAWVVLWGRGQAEVLVRIVAAHDEAVSLVVDFVFVASAAAGDQRWFGIRLPGGNEVSLGGDLIARGDDDVAP